MRREFTSDEIMLISDTHFSHKNIINYTDRPFEYPHTSKMDMLMLEGFIDIDNQNKTLFHMGDLMMNNSKFLLECGWRPKNDHYIILGNHDTNGDVDGSLRSLYEQFFTYIIGTSDKKRYKNNTFDIKIDGMPIQLSHHVQEHINGYAYNIHGHHHNDFFKRPEINNEEYPYVYNSDQYINVCVELTNYVPVSFEDALKIPKPKYSKI